MKRIIFLIIYVFVFSCKSEMIQIFDTPQKVIVTGKVYDFHPNYRNVGITINRLGYPQENMDVPFDSTGCFKATFGTYLPTDIRVHYRTTFTAIAHPNDSIYVEFDASKNSTAEVMKTIKYGGDGSKTNQDIALMQMKFESFVLNNRDEGMKAMKDLDTQEYLAHIDSVFQHNKDLFAEFVSEATPTDEAKLWAQMYIEEAYFSALSMYPMVHPNLNNLSNFDVEPSYYDPLTKHAPLTKVMLTNAYSMDSYVSTMYGWAATITKESTKIPITQLNFDSVYTYGIIDHITDPLLRQLVLFRKFYGKIEQNRIDYYEEYKPLADLYIKETFLRNQLSEFYAKRKNELDAPKILTDSIFSELNKTTVGPVFDTILSKSKDKVVYIDCWAVWCGPCISFFPDSRKLHDELKGQPIEFVYLCIESDSVRWQSLVKQHQIEGQNYLLNDLQSKELRKAFNINGIPHYIIIDKKGVIVKKEAESPRAEAEYIMKLI